MIITLLVDYYITGRFITLLVDLLHYWSIITLLVVTDATNGATSGIALEVIEQNMFQSMSAHQAPRSATANGGARSRLFARND